MYKNLTITYLFLDFDGILNVFSGEKEIESHLVNNLKLILKEINIKIIITSDRRSDDDFNIFWKSNQLPIFHDKTNFNIKNVTGNTLNMGLVRANEINEYINTNMIKNFIIIDDLNLKGFSNGVFFKCNPYLGLTRKITDKIIKDFKQK